MQEQTYLVALAGLLHDIGKFAVRAGESATRSLDKEAASDFGYKHALLTADFIERYVPEPWRVQVKNAAGNHHRPLHRPDKIVALADHLSAGERADVTGEERAIQPRQLLSIFCALKAPEGAQPQDKYWPLAALAMDETVLFPGKPLAEGEVWQRYAALWEAFGREAAQLRDAHGASGDLPAYLESLLLLLQRYTWCMPSAYYRNRPDVSLYDHARMTAALAAVLEGSSVGDAGLNTLYSAPDSATTPLALLVGGDISGVQDFIYTITARGATSALRGRSFYLQLLTEAVARFVLRRLDLPITNLIYAGGGHFYLLARSGDAGALTAVQAEISRVLLQQHRGDLYVALARQELAACDFFAGRISAAWRSLSAELQQAKQRRFVELGDDLARLFAPEGRGGGEQTQCQVCGAEHSAAQEYRKRPDEEGVRKCPPCASYEELGESLRSARYLALAEGAVETPGVAAEPGRWEEPLARLGLRARLAATPEQLADLGGARQVHLALDDAARLRLKPGGNRAIGQRFLVNVTPTISAAEIACLREKHIDDLPEREGIKPFSALAAQARGIKRMGVLRMDVDNLGRLFAEGLGQQATLSRVAALSFAISLFFEGWVERLASERNRTDARGERLYSIYSGGDDLFFVGAWDAIVELARAIRIDLARYAVEHPEVHVSAGIALIDGKYPLYQAAQDAKKAEDQAKSLIWRNGDGVQRKDAISFLGQALPWQRFGLEPCTQQDIGSAHALMHLLAETERRDGPVDGAASQALVRRLIRLYQQYDEAGRQRRERGDDRTGDGQPQVLWGRWMWLGYYYLGRMAKQTKNDAIRDLRDQLKADDFRSMEWVGLAARWAELLGRTENH